MTRPPSTIPRKMDLENDDLKRIRNTFGFAPENTVQAALTEATGSFDRLRKQERRSLWDSLDERRDSLGIQKITSLLDKWKNGVRDNKRAAKTYEELVKKALEWEQAEVRFSDLDSSELFKPDIETYCDLYRITQVFAEANFSEGDRLYRGIRKKSVAELVAQLLDDPAAEEYSIKTSVVSNHSGSKSIGINYADGVVIAWNVPRHRTAMAVDQLRDTSPAEDEYHVLGGVVDLTPEEVLHFGHYTQDLRKIQTTIQAIESPAQIGAEIHKDLIELLRIMFDNDVGVKSEDGVERLDEWLDYLQRTTVADEYELSSVELMVEYVQKVDTDGST